MTNYQHRLDAVEGRLGNRSCMAGSCVKCALANLGASLRGGLRVICDERPQTLVETLTKIGNEILERSKS